MTGYLKYGFVLLAAVWAALIGNMVGYAWNLSHSRPILPGNGFPQPEIVIESQEQQERRWTVAVFGVDSREGSLGKETRSDMQMIFNVNLESGEIRIVSVYRDTYLKIGGEKYDKINEAYFKGGPEQAAAALGENLDLTIDDYISFSWKAAADAINLLGGIDVELSPEEFGLINGFITETVKSTGIGSMHLTKEGPNHLDGVQAVAYARLRKIDTDFKRTERQRQVAALVLKKARQADVATLSQVLSAVLPQTSSTIGLSDLLPVVKRMKQFYIGETKGFPMKLKDALIDKKDCVAPLTLEENVAELHRFLFDEEDYQPSEGVKTISRYIEGKLK